MKRFDISKKLIGKLIQSTQNMGWKRRRSWLRLFLQVGFIKSTLQELEFLERFISRTIKLVSCHYPLYT